MNKLSIIIVNYRVKHYLDQCLLSVEKAIKGLDADVWVVDNRSGDDSISCLRRWHPEVHFIENSENLGFSRANNQAVRLSESDYVLLLNPDTVVGEDVLRECVSFMDRHPEAGAVGVKMLSADGRFAKESRRGVPTPVTAFFKMCGLCSLFPKSRWFGRYYLGFLDREEPCEIEIVSGAFMMLNRSAINKVGLLDEDFFMYGEDIDLSYRLLKGGYHNYYLPHPIIHYKGESTVKSSYRYVYVFYQAMLIFFRKHFGGYGLLVSYLVNVAVCLKGALAFLKMQIGKWCRPFCRKRVQTKRTTVEIHSSASESRERVLELLNENHWRGNMCVYDASAVSYAEAIRQAELQLPEGPERKECAFVYPERKTLITASKVYVWNS